MQSVCTAQQISRESAPAGVWLVTNNLVTGGAQSSARRLLLDLRARGQRVRVALVLESPDSPSIGRRALRSEGVDVLVVPRGSGVAGLLQLLEALDADAARAVLMWNLTPHFKIPLGDALLHTRLIDVSPGEHC